MTLPEDLASRGCKTDITNKVNVRLSELGPRLTLQLIKIEEGISDGEVSYSDVLVAHSVGEVVKPLRGRHIG